MHSYWRLANLWCNTNKRLSLHGLSVLTAATQSAQVVREPWQITQGLAAAWAPVFSTKHIQTRTARAYLARFETKYDWTLTRSPEKEDIDHFLKFAPRSASGPHEKPCAGWKAAGEDGVNTLWQVLVQLMNDIPMHLSSNDSASIFSAKGGFDEDHFGLV